MTGIAYILPFAIVWAVFLVWPVIYGFYISLWQWDPLRGSTFVGLGNYGGSSTPSGSSTPRSTPSTSRSSASRSSWPRPPLRGPAAREALSG
jgi:ABC-type sugar transport system permease subunit